MQDKGIHLLILFKNKEAEKQGVWGWRHKGEAIKIILAVWRCQKDRQAADRQTETHTLPDTDKEAGTTMYEATIKKYKRADSQGGAGGG